MKLAELRFRPLPPTILILMILALAPAVTTGAGQTMNRSTEHQYKGYLRLYVVEPTSRYHDALGVPFDFGFLGFAYNQMITLNYRDTISESVSFSGANLQENNIQVIAVLFNGEGHPASSNPDSTTNFYTAYFVDAATAAAPGQTGEDSTSGGYTHTVFLEEATDAG